MMCYVSLYTLMAYYNMFLCSLLNYCMREIIEYALTLQILYRAKLSVKGVCIVPGQKSW